MGRQGDFRTARGSGSYWSGSGSEAVLGAGIEPLARALEGGVVVATQGGGVVRSLMKLLVGVCSQGPHQHTSEVDLIVLSFWREKQYPHRK